MITFILNNEYITTRNASGGSLLDFIRNEAGLYGTKVGCREGDCGACTVLMGTPENGTVKYKSIVSCLTPLGNAHGKHIVTIEGINTGHLTHVQKAIVENSATQCGFCTPGFVMSLTAESLSLKQSTKETTIASVSGNICRCTGYKSIERAAEEIATALHDKDISDPVTWLVTQRDLPEYFLSIPQRLSEINKPEQMATDALAIAGGTDMMVQRPEELAGKEVDSFAHREDLKGIKVENETIVIGSATTLNEIKESEIIERLIPCIASDLMLIASEPVRNMATVGGNIVNASPIGDFTIMLLALDADVIIEGPEGSHAMKLNEFYTGYKKLKLLKGEILKSISVNNRPALFSFEKVSKRKHLDIASVNSAMRIRIEDNKVIECSISAGGVSPVPLHLKATGSFFYGKEVAPETIRQAAEIMNSEIFPISDVRGSAEYKRLLLRQLLFAHFIKLFPERIKSGDLL